MFSVLQKQAEEQGVRIWRSRQAAAERAADVAALQRMNADEEVHPVAAPQMPTVAANAGPVARYDVLTGPERPKSRIGWASQRQVAAALFGPKNRRERDALARRVVEEARTGSEGDFGSLSHYAQAFGHGTAQSRLSERIAAERASGEVQEGLAARYEGARLQREEDTIRMRGSVGNDVANRYWGDESNRIERRRRAASAFDSGAPSVNDEDWRKNRWAHTQGRGDAGRRNSALARWEDEQCRLPQGEIIGEDGKPTGLFRYGHRIINMPSQTRSKPKSHSDVIYSVRAPTSWRKGTGEVKHLRVGDIEQKRIIKDWKDRGMRAPHPLPQKPADMSDEQWRQYIVALKAAKDPEEAAAIHDWFVEGRWRENADGDGGAQ